MLIINKNKTAGLRLLLAPCIFFLFAAIGPSPTLCAQESAKWVLKTDKEGIKVYIEEKENTPIKQFKAVATYEATLSSLVAVLKDVPERPKWSDGVNKAEFLKEGRDNWIMYLLIDMPWPLEGRDMVLENSLEQDPHTKIVTLNLYNAPKLIPAKAGLIRIATAEGKWVLTPLEKGGVEVSYQFRADPGGSIPLWVVNLFLVDGPFKTLRNLKTMVAKTQYKNVKLPYLVE